MGEVVPARTSPTLHPPSPPTVHHMIYSTCIIQCIVVAIDWQVTVDMSLYGEINHVLHLHTQ